MDWEMKWGPLPVWAWGTIATLAVAIVVMQRRNAATNPEAPQIVRSPGVTQVQPLIITPPGAVSTPTTVSDNANANYYGGM